MKVLCIFVGLVIAGKTDYHEKASMILELKDRKVSSCGASIVGRYRLVTTAHCLSKAKSIKVRVGSQYLFYQGTQFRTTDFTPHPDFNLSSRFRDNDIGIVIIKQGLQFSEKVQPVALPLKGTAPEKVGEWAKAAGWGMTSDSQRNNKTVYIGTLLNEVKLKIINVMRCKRRLNGNKMPQTTVCTSGAGGRGTCGGDSGGPLVVKRNGENVLVGVTSYGALQCESKNPSVFTRVASYLLFICCGV